MSIKNIANKPMQEEKSLIKILTAGDDAAGCQAIVGSVCKT